MEQESHFGICICGLNGSGKTTLGRELSKKSGFYHMDVENYYFSETDCTYSSPRSREEVQRLLLADMQKYRRFVFSAVNGNMSDEINPEYRLVVYLHVPLEVRMERIRKRSYARFGSRMLVGGDLYEREEAFFAFAAKRTSAHIEEWLATRTCPVLRLDGTEALEYNIAQIQQYIPKPTV